MDKIFLILKKKSSVAAIVALVLAVVWYTNSGPETSTASFKLKAVKTGEILRVVAASGSVNAVIEVEVGSQISGQIKELYADFNDVVKKGQMVALIDPEIYEMRLRQREAELAISIAESQSKLAQLSSDKAALAFTVKDMDRKLKLFKQGNVSSAMIDAAQTEKQKAQDRVLMSKAAIATSKANIQQRQSSLEQAQVELSRTQIRAPIDGVVIARQVDVGQTVAASMQAPTLFHIANDLKNIRVEASVDEADIGQVKSNQNVSFTVDAYPDRKFGGNVEVVRLAPEISQNVVTYTVTILAKNDDMSLLPGMTANIEIVIGRRENVSLVPNDAVRFKPKSVDGASRQAQTFSPSAMAENIVKRYSESLSLTPKQREEIKSEIESVLKANMSTGSQAQGESSGSSMRAAMQKMQSRIAKKITEIGTDEQIKAFQAMSKNAGRHGAGEGKRGVLWVVGEGGKPEARPVKLGLSDNSNTEVLKGLKAGDEVITGYVKRKPNK